jgi:hypothetical protein
VVLVDGDRVEAQLLGEQHLARPALVELVGDLCVEVGVGVVDPGRLVAIGVRRLVDVVVVVEEVELDVVEDVHEGRPLRSPCAHLCGVRV